MAYNVCIPVRSILSIEKDDHSILIKTSKKDYEIWDKSESLNTIYHKLEESLMSQNSIVFLENYTTCSNPSKRLIVTFKIRV